MVSFKIVLMGAHGFSFCLFFMFQCQKAVAVVSSFLEASSLRENIFSAERKKQIKIKIKILNKDLDA